MPRVLAIALGFVAASIAVPCSGQESKPAKGTITTTGSATVQVQPDTVRITFGHQIRLSGLKEVRAENERQVKKLGDALAALKIDKLKIDATTSSVQVSLTANAGGAPGLADVPLMPSGYQLTTSFTVTAKANDIGKLRDIAKRVGDAALENGANVSPNSIVQSSGFGGGGPGLRNTAGRVFSPGVEIFREDMGTLHNKALSGAVKNAFMKAEALAAGANAKNLKIVAISDEASLPASPNPMDSLGPTRGLAGILLASYAVDAPAATMRTSLTVRVRVTCSFE